MFKIWAILNLNSDSFFAESRVDSANLEKRCLTLLAEGADVIDIGAESTRPYAQAISWREEWQRLEKPLLALKSVLAEKFSSAISIDTYKPEVAEKVLELGINIINDVSGGRDEKMFAVVAQSQATYVLMHSLAASATMQDNPSYENVVVEVHDYLLYKTQRATEAGVKKENIIWDFGIGFGKTLEHNLSLLSNTKSFAKHSLMVGVSRKSLFAELLGLKHSEDRKEASLSLHTYLALQGVENLRVHDVAITAQMRTLLQNLNRNTIG